MVLNRKQRIAQQFGKAAKRYDNAAQVQSDIGFDALQTVPLSGQKALDIGCGTGRLTQLLAQRFESVNAMDLSEGMINQAKQECAGTPNITFTLGDAESIPFAHNQFDFVFSSMVLQWCDPISISFREAYRVLKPGGAGMIALLSEGSLHELATLWQEMGEPHRVNQFVSHHYLIEQMLAVGFKIKHEQKSYITEHPDLMSLLNSIRHVGASAIPFEGSASMLTRAKIRDMQMTWIKHFGDEGLLPLTYNVSFLRISKPL